MQHFPRPTLQALQSNSWKEFAHLPICVPQNSPALSKAFRTACCHKPYSTPTAIVPQLPLSHHKCCTTAEGDLQQLPSPPHPGLQQHPLCTSPQPSLHRQSGRLCPPDQSQPPPPPQQQRCCSAKHCMQVLLNIKDTGSTTATSQLDCAIQLQQVPAAARIYTVYSSASSSRCCKARNHRNNHHSNSSSSSSHLCLLHAGGAGALLLLLNWCIASRLCCSGPPMLLPQLMA